MLPMPSQKDSRKLALSRLEDVPISFDFFHLHDWSNQSDFCRTRSKLCSRVATPRFDT
jgi:hypothetical protein